MLKDRIVVASAGMIHEPRRRYQGILTHTFFYRITSPKDFPLRNSEEAFVLEVR